MSVVLLVLVVGVLLRVGLQFLTLVITGNGRDEFQTSRSTEMFCRGTDVWLLGWGGLMTMTVRLALQVAAIAFTLAVSLLFLCLYARMQRLLIYDRCPRRADSTQIMVRWWIAWTATEYLA